jgi:hypothetical protein
MPTEQTVYVLESLSIRRGYSDFACKGPLHASVKFKGPAGAVEIDLGPDASAAVLAVVSDQVVEAASLRAADMRAAFVDGASEARKALPAN